MKRRLCVDYQVGIALGLAAAEERVAIVWLAGVSHWVFDFTGDDFLLARSAVAHAAAVVEVEIVGLREFEDVFFVVPIECERRFLESNFWHVEQRAIREVNCKSGSALFLFRAEGVLCF